MLAPLAKSVLIFVQLAVVLAINVVVDSGSNPTYLQLCLEGQSKTVASVQVKVYDWSNDSSPVEAELTMTQAGFDPKCFFASAGPPYDLFFVPLTLTLVSTDDSMLVLTDIVTQITGATFSGPDFGGMQTNIPPNPGLLPTPQLPDSLGPFRAAATFFSSGVVACQTNNDGSTSPAYTGFYAAVNYHIWGLAVHCGECIRLWNANLTKSVDVMVIDECPSGNKCTHQNWLDISPSAFDSLGVQEWGIQQIQWQYVSCSKIDSAMRYRFANYSSQFGFEIQVVNHVYGLRNVEIQATGSSTWITLEADIYGTWTFNGGVGSNPQSITCPCNLRLTALGGEQVIEPDTTLNKDIALLPRWNTWIQGQAQFVPPDPYTFGGSDNSSGNAAVPDVATAFLGALVIITTLLSSA